MTSQHVAHGSFIAYAYRSLIEADSDAAVLSGLSAEQWQKCKTMTNTQWTDLM